MKMDGTKYEPLAEIEVDAARPDPQGFTLTGQGADHAEYQLDLHFGMPLDAKTRSVLGELLSHSDLTISRRPPGGLVQALRQRRNRASQAQFPGKSGENP
jgi:hypothetical protein